MESIKAKRKDGKVCYGVIDEERNEIVDFKYKEIVPYSKYIYYCKGYDDSWDLFEIFNGNVTKLLDSNGAYELVEYLQDSDFIARKNGKVGIIGFYDDKLKSIYKFGKASEIIKEEDESVKLIKHKKNGMDLVGFFNDPKYGTFDPEYISINKYGLYVGDKIPKGHEYDADYNHRIDLLIYSKLVDGEILYGVKQIAKNPNTIGVFELVDFLPCEYSSIEFKNNNIIELTQKKDGKNLKGAVCYTTFWNYHNNYGLRAKAELVKAYTIPCEYDSIRHMIFDSGHEYIDLFKDNKVKRLAASWNRIAGYYNCEGRMVMANPSFNYLGNGKFYNSIERVDDIAFLGHRYHGCDILFNEKSSFYSDDSLTIKGNYDSLKKIYNIYNSDERTAYLATLKNGGVQYIKLDHASGVNKIIKSDVVKSITFINYGIKDHVALVVELENGKKNVYDMNYELIEENIDSFKSYDSFYELSKKYESEKNIYDFNNQLMFITEKNYEVTEIDKINHVFAIKNHNTGDVRLKLCKQFSSEVEEERYETFKMVMEGHTFKSFDAYKHSPLNGFYPLILCDAVIKYPDGTKTRKLANINFGHGSVDYISTGNFEVEGYNKDYSRTIISLYDPKDDSKDSPFLGASSYAVIDNNDGSIVIPFDYSEIIYNEENDSFICTPKVNDEEDKEKIEIDVDGFEIIKDEKSAASNEEIDAKKLVKAKN